MRRHGVLDGTHTVSFAWEPIMTWAREIVVHEAWEGVWNTLVLTQMVLVGTGMFALLSFPFACRHLTGKLSNRLTHFGLIVMRTTPEYILAYLFVQLWGPSRWNV